MAHILQTIKTNHMIHFSTGKGKYLAVNVPVGSTGHMIVTYSGEKAIMHSMNLNCGIGPNGLIPVRGAEKIIGRASELTDEQCKDIVEDVGKDTFGATCYDDYECREWVLGRCYSNPIASFNSLLRANSIPPNYLIIKID